MTDRNDNAALTILGKIIDRMTTDKAEHDQRVATHIAQVQQIQYALNQLNAMNSQQLQQTRNSQLNQMAQTQYAAMYGNHTHTITYNRPTLASVMEWVPYLTQQEFEALKAWRNGEDVLLHLLSRD